MGRSQRHLRRREGTDSAGSSRYPGTDYTFNWGSTWPGGPNNPPVAPGDPEDPANQLANGNFNTGVEGWSAHSGGVITYDEENQALKYDVGGSTWSSGITQKATGDVLAVTFDLSYEIIATSSQAGVRIGPSPGSNNTYSSLGKGVGVHAHNGIFNNYTNMYVTFVGVSGEDVVIDNILLKAQGAQAATHSTPAWEVFGPYTTHGLKYWIRCNDIGLWEVGFDIDADPSADVWIDILELSGIEDNQRTRIHQKARGLGWDG